MTVKDLIEDLQKYPEDVQVEYEYCYIGHVEYDEDYHTVVIHGY